MSPPRAAGIVNLLAKQLCNARYVVPGIEAIIHIPNAYWSNIQFTTSPHYHSLARMQHIIPMVSAASVQSQRKGMSQNKHELELESNANQKRRG